MALIIILTLIQAVFTGLLYRYHPYSNKQLNLQLKITQTLYLVLEIFFFTLIGWGKTASERFRYYVIGFGMIGVVFVILISSISFSLYFTYVSLRQRWRDHKEKKNLLKEESKLELNESSQKIEVPSSKHTEDKQQETIKILDKNTEHTYGKSTIKNLGDESDPFDHKQLEKRTINKKSIVKT